MAEKFEADASEVDSQPFTQVERGAVVNRTTGLIIRLSRGCWWAVPQWTICASLSHPVSQPGLREYSAFGVL